MESRCNARYGIRYPLIRDNQGDPEAAGNAAITVGGTDRPCFMARGYDPDLRIFERRQ